MKNIVQQIRIFCVRHMDSTLKQGLISGLISASYLTTFTFLLRIFLGTPFFPEVVVEWFFSVVPGELEAFAVENLGVGAKYLAFGSAIAGQLIIGTVLGWVFLKTYRMLPSDNVLSKALIFSSLIWLISLPFDYFFLTGTIYPAAVTFLFSLIYGLPLAQTYYHYAPDEWVSTSRRKVIISGTLIASGIIAGLLGLVWRGIQRQEERNDALEELGEMTSFNKEDLQKSEGSEEFFAVAEGLDLKGLPSEITPINEFYSVNIGMFGTNIEVDYWMLKVGGLVETPLELSFEDIRQLPPVSTTATLMCISNPIGGELIDNADWKGVRLKTILDKAGGLKEGAVDIVLKAADGYRDSFPVSKGLEDDTILVYEMNGAPLEDKNGYPIRALVPNIYGMKNVKWITEIEVVPEDIKGYWQARGWSDTAVINTFSMISIPKRNTKGIVGEVVPVGGVAFAGNRGINRVEVSVDAGNTWDEAVLKPAISQKAWSLWLYRWTPQVPGEYMLLVRATDGNGELQTAVKTITTFPDGATGYHFVKFQVEY